MTSREKLLRLRHDFYTNDSIDYDSISYFTSIEKDLEVLEIIKKHSFLNLSVLADYDISEFDEYFDDWYNTTNELDRKEFELLKEWLEND